MILKRHTRTYLAVDTHKRIIRKVVCIETYKDSQHWQVEIYPEGYGSNPAPIIFSQYLDGSSTISQQSEGYGIFRPEYAFFLAECLTGNKMYIEQQREEA